MKLMDLMEIIVFLYKNDFLKHQEPGILCNIVSEYFLTKENFELLKNINNFKYFNLN